MRERERNHQSRKEKEKIRRRIEEERICGDVERTEITKTETEVYEGEKRRPTRPLGHGVEWTEERGRRWKRETVSIPSRDRPRLALTRNL